MLKVNTSIDFLEIGHNRIRQKGLEAISEGILAQKGSKMKTLGIRMNFINDDGFTRFFEEVVLSGMSSLENLYVSQNNLTDYKAAKLCEKVRENKLKLYIDQFEKLNLQVEDKMSKTLWFQLGATTPEQFCSDI